MPKKKSPPAPVRKANDNAARIARETKGRLFTLRDWLRYATSLFNAQKLFFGQGAPDATAEAVWLLRHALHLPRNDELWAQFLDARLTEDEAAALCEVLARRAFGREPAAYITGEAWLGEHSFRVDPRVIIPRSYFLEIIPGQLQDWLGDVDAPMRAADVCTGSGCLAILLALACPETVIDATDLSTAALEVAALNVADYGLRDRIHLHRADVLEGVPPDSLPAGGYDIILCNPPYEPEDVLKNLPEEFRKEPPQALVSGPEGMDVIRRLLAQSTRLLAPNGILLIEVGGLREKLEAEYPALEFNWLPTHDASDCIALLHATNLRATL
ncbi:MAG: 50S ribosomal protein L3 N(5)-glutamine methyltransferase [Puniceicoccales bacterium]|jgi:ribosomal protein L3 glutamine methyltransferase|nr:50S ribosomal protein L3 N(5)-glutamine methyltransferase [Puniceicoccales bacterium]